MKIPSESVFADMGYSVLVRQLNFLPKNRGYHDNRHMELVGELVNVISRYLKLEREKSQMLYAAARYSDFAFVLGAGIKDHEPQVVDFLRSDKLFANNAMTYAAKKVADLIAAGWDKPMLTLDELEAQGKKDGWSMTVLAAILRIADYFAQCSSPSYIPQLKNLFREFNEWNCSRGTMVRFNSVEELVKDEFIQKQVWPYVESFAKIPQIKSSLKVLELNLAIRKAWPADRSFDELMTLYMNVSGVDFHEINWDLPITTAHLKEILEKAATLDRNPSKAS